MPDEDPANKSSTKAAGVAASIAPASWVPTGLLLAVFLAGAAVLWGVNWTRGRAACDQYEWHLRAILKFASELPGANFRDYPSATTPGYHLLMGAAARCITHKPLALQVLASGFTVALLVVIGRAIARAGARRGHEMLALAALALPVVCSPYVFTSGVYLLPDNAGLLLTLAVLLPVLNRPPTRGALALCALMFALAVFVRQSQLWLAAPIVTAAWLAPTPSRDESLAGALRRPSSRLARFGGALLACAPALIVVAAFAVLWRGLTPPTFQQQHLAKGLLGLNWSTPPFILALFGVFSPFYIGWIWPGLAKLWRESRWFVVGVAAVAAGLACIPETTFLYESRASGLWNVVKLLQVRGIVIAGHASPLIFGLAALGAVMLAALLALIDDKRRWTFASAIAAFIAAQSANANCWQRYHEPLLLVLMALIAARYSPADAELGSARRPSILPVLRIIGPLALAALLAVVTVGGLITGRDPLAKPEPPTSSTPRDPGR